MDPNPNIPTPNLGASTLTGNDGTLTSSTTSALNPVAMTAGPSTPGAVDTMNGPDAQAALDKAQNQKIGEAIGKAGAGMNAGIGQALQHDASFNTVFGHTASTPVTPVSAPISGSQTLGQQIQMGNPGQMSSIPMVAPPQVPQTVVTSDRRAKTNIRTPVHDLADFLNALNGKR